MKFLYFSDAHIKGVNSRNRLGNYFDDVLKKFDELLLIAKQNNVTTILDGGDLLDGESPSYRILDELADRAESVGIPIYSLFGNHAEAYGHIETSRYTGLAHLQKRSKLFRYLDELQDNTFIIKGIEYKHGIEEELKDKSIILASNKKEGDNTSEFKVLITHALITPSKFFKDVSYCECHDIKTNADLVLMAHYHHPFQKKINDTTFLNIGAFGRDNINEAKLEPSVLLLDTDKRSWEIIKLKSAKSSNDIFDLSKYEELKDNEKSIQEFLDSLKDVQFQGMDLSQQIVKVAKEQNIEEKISKHLLKKIEVIKNEQ